MEVGRRLGRGGKHIQLVSQPIRLFLICSVSPPRIPPCWQAVHVFHLFGLFVASN
jgi:hypothetical protein